MRIRLVRDAAKKDKGHPSDLRKTVTQEIGLMFPIHAKQILRFDAFATEMKHGAELIQNKAP
jgi:hypothetical protein